MLKNLKNDKCCHAELVSVSFQKNHLRDPEINSGGRKHRRGSVLIYAIILVNMVVFLALLVFSRSEILLKNANLQEYNSKLTKNIDEKTALAIKFDDFLNSDGGGFTETTECPTVTYSGATTTNVVTIPTLNPDNPGEKLRCVGGVTGDQTTVTYSPDYKTFNTLIYNEQVVVLSYDTGTSKYSGVLPDGTAVSFTLGTDSHIDANFDSDDYTPYSHSGSSTQYPNGYVDDDALAREVFYGYIRRKADWYNIFWNNSEISKFIKENPNNNDSYHLLMGDTTNARLFLDVDQPADLRIIEFDTGSYDRTKELKKVSDVIYHIDSSGFGYVNTGALISQTPLMYSGTFSGSINTSNQGLTPITLDFKNRYYGIFLSFTETVRISDFVTYKLRFTTPTGSGVYVVPLDDSKEDFFYYLGNDIIIDSEKNFVSKQLKLSRTR